MVVRIWPAGFSLLTPGMKCQPALTFYISDLCLNKSRVELVKQRYYLMNTISMRVSFSGIGKGTVKLEAGVRVE